MGRLDGVTVRSGRRGWPDNAERGYWRRNAGRAPGSAGWLAGLYDIDGFEHRQSGYHHHRGDHDCFDHVRSPPINDRGEHHRTVNNHGFDHVRTNDIRTNDDRSDHDCTDHGRNAHDAVEHGGGYQHQGVDVPSDHRDPQVQGDGGLGWW